MCLIVQSESLYLPMTVSPEMFSTVALPFKKKKKYERFGYIFYWLMMYYILLHLRQVDNDFHLLAVASSTLGRREFLKA